jgi:hypothetical protein
VFPARLTHEAALRCEVAGYHFLEGRLYDFAQAANFGIGAIAAGDERGKAFIIGLAQHGDSITHLGNQHTSCTLMPQLVRARYIGEMSDLGPARRY